MAMEKGLKIRISRLFQSSLNSCRSKNNNYRDVYEQSANHFQHRQLIEIFSPKHYYNSSTTHLNCQFCPPRAAPVLIKKRNKKRTKRVRSRTFWMQEFPPSNYNGLFSSDEDTEEDEEDDTTLFSSDSSDLLLRRRSRRNKNGRRKKKSLCTDELESGGFAVVKRSKDPYSDFMNSMVEMITEKQIFAREDLEKLLQSFLSLNSDIHHNIIIQVFKQIWEALFTEQ